MCHYRAINLFSPLCFIFYELYVVTFRFEINCEIVKTYWPRDQSIGTGNRPYQGFYTAASLHNEIVSPIYGYYQVPFLPLSTHPRSTLSSHKLETLVPFSLVASSEVSP
jgi:hypothetical protein